MKKIIFFLCYLLLITSLVFAQDINHDMINPTRNKNAEAAYKEGTNYYEAQNFEKAEEFFKKALKFDPDFIDASNFLGLIYYRQSKNVEAIKTFEKAIKDAQRLKVSDIMLHLNLALAYEENGMIDKAISAYLHVVANDENNPEGNYGLALLLYNNGKEVRALEFFKYAFNLYMKNESHYAFQALYFIAACYYKLGDYNLARMSYSKIKDDLILKEYGISNKDIDMLRTAEKKEKEALKKANFKFQKYGLNVKSVPYLKEIQPPKKFGISVEKAFEFTDGSGLVYYAYAKENKPIEMDSVYAFIHQTSQKLAGKEPSLREIYASKIDQSYTLKEELGADFQIVDALVFPQAPDLNQYNYVWVNAIYQKGNGIIFQIALIKDVDFDMDQLFDSYFNCSF